MLMVALTCQQSVSVSMGAAEIPSQSSETIKIPTAQYEFGVNYMDPKVRSGQNFLDFSGPQF